MQPPIATTPALDRPYGVSRSTAGAVALLVVALLVGLRATSESAMMSEHGSDPQMAIWLMFLVGKLGFWLLTGGLLSGLLAATWSKRRASLIVLALLFGWSVAIGVASWQYLRARQALADASNPSTSPGRLHDLVSFVGIKAGYELDNRLASHPNTAAEDLRKLYQRNQLGTQMKLAANPNTPDDILEELVEHEDIWVQRCLARNPKLPEPVFRKLKDHPDAEVRNSLSGSNRKK